MVNVLRWFVGTLKGQYTSRNEKSGSEKKPLNPILGEQFIGKWSDKEGTGETELITEQVSHHPPITAYWLRNAKAGVTLEGHSGQKTSFSGRSISVKQVGHAVLRVANSSGGEDLFLITLPNLVIEGLWYGAPYLELSGSSYICSTTGYLATINYSGKGYFSGKSHTYKAEISHVSQPKSPFYTIEGEWSAVSKFKGKSPDGSSNATFWDASTPRREVEVAPVDQQGDSESRKVWKKVADGIRSGDFDTASREKSRIENEQRQKRKDEIAKASPHQLEYFVHVDDDKECEWCGAGAVGCCWGDYKTDFSIARTHARTHRLGAHFEIQRIATYTRRLQAQTSGSLDVMVTWNFSGQCECVFLFC